MFVPPNVSFIIHYFYWIIVLDLLMLNTCSFSTTECVFFNYIRPVTGQVLLLDFQYFHHWICRLFGYVYIMPIYTGYVFHF